MADNYDYMAPMWASFVQWASNSVEMVQQFNEETGSDYKHPKAYVEMLIDDATGKAETDAFKFARWVTERHWGMEYAPQSFRDDCNKRDTEAGKCQ